MSTGAYLAMGIAGAVAVAALPGRRHGALIACAEVLVAALVATAASVGFLPTQPTAFLGLAYVLSRLYVLPSEPVGGHSSSSWKALGFDVDAARAERRLYLLPVVATFVGLLARQSSPSLVQTLAIAVGLAWACPAAISNSPNVARGALLAVLLFALP